MGTLWKSRWRLSVVLGIIAVIVATSIQFAISLASNQLSKESFVNENAQLTNKHGEVVQTVGAHFDYNDPDRNEIRQLDAGSLGAVKSITFSMGSDMEVFKINGVRIANADVPEERSVTFLSPYGTITASKDRIALNHVNGRRLWAPLLGGPTEDHFGPNDPMQWPTYKAHDQWQGIQHYPIEPIKCSIQYAPGPKIA